MKRLINVGFAIMLLFTVALGGCKPVDDGSGNEGNTSQLPVYDYTEDTTPVLFDIPPQAADRVIEGMTLVYSDEFNGTELDTNKWSYESEEWSSQNQAVQKYRNANVEVGGGYMTINILNKNMAIAEADRGVYVTSGSIQTKNRYAQTYGRIEARMKLPTYVGAWPGFWMMPEDNSRYNTSVGRGWPYNGELDIVEGKGRFNTRVSGTLHTAYNASSYAQKSVGGSYYMNLSSPVDRFHIYALIWDKDYMHFEVDGFIYQTITKEQWTSDYYKNHFPENPSAPFDRNFYLTLSCGVGGTWDGYRLPDIENFEPAVMQVDYVRFYQFDKYLA